MLLIVNIGERIGFLCVPQVLFTMPPRNRTFFMVPVPFVGDMRACIVGEVMLPYRGYYIIFVSTFSFTFLTRGALNPPRNRLLVKKIVRAPRRERMNAIIHIVPGGTYVRQ